MANRPYLFCCDSPDYLDQANWDSIFRSDEVPYYDARWCMPYSWFFFYKPSDLIMYTVYAYKGGSSWTEPRFFAEKTAALKTFMERRNLLAAVAKSPYSSKKALDHLVDNLSKWPGAYLYMDPTEVIEDTDEGAQENCASILRQIEDPNTSIADLLVVLGQYSSFNYKDESDYRMHLVGTTYTWTRHPF